MSKHYFYVITGSSNYKRAPRSLFIFSLRNKENLQPFKARLKDQNTQYTQLAQQIIIDQHLE
jgi:predicted patatin/cPLA2 family phospholipase